VYVRSSQTAVSARTALTSPVLFTFCFSCFYFDNVFAVVAPAGGANVVTKLGLVTSGASFNGWQI
jgi:hypothetical protein